MGGHTIRSNRMAPKNSMELSDSLRIKNRSIEVNLEMFFLFVSVKSELWVNVLPTCTGIVAVIKPPLTWEKFDLPEWQILSCYRAKLKLNTNDEWQLSIHTFCWGSRYTQVSFSAKKKSQSCIFDEPNYVFIYIHRVKTTSFQWTSHISWHCGPLYWIKKQSRRREKT